MKLFPSSSIFRGRLRSVNERRPGRHRAALRLESLETRALLSGTFTALTNVAPGYTGTAMLETNGTVLAQGGGVTNTWYQLTPDSSGSYANGTWSQVASSGLNRLYFGSNVLPSGNILIQGGEYSGPSGTENDVNSGEIFNPITNTWKPIATFPQSSFGDDPSEVLPNGSVLAGYVSGPQTYIYNPTTNAWRAAGTKLRNDQSDEEAWVKLPDNSILSYDVFASISSGVGSAQRYIPSTNTWVDAGTVPVELSSAAVGYELGAGFLLPDGRVFYLGGNSNTAFYTESTNSWTAGPVIPNGLGCDDAPGAVLPNGDILFTADTPLFNAPAKVFEFNPTTNVYTDLTSELPSSYLSGPAYIDRMLVLPSGQVLVSNTSKQLYVFTPDQAAVAAAVPTITGLSENSDGSYLLSGTQLNGINEGASYGDDAEMSSNYPIVRLTSSTGKVYFGRTYNWSSTGVATGSTPESTSFTLPIGLPASTYQVVVVANGVASTPVSLTVPTNNTDPAPTVAVAASATPNPDGGVSSALSVLGADTLGESTLTYSWATTSLPSGAVSPSFSVNGTNAAKNDTVTFTHTGTYSFTVTITNLAGLATTSSISVVVTPTFTSLSVIYSGQTKPSSPVNVSPGGTKTFIATGLDQFGNTLASQPTIIWAVTSGGGTVSSTGVYTAPTTGTMATVTATAGALSGSGSAWVLTAPYVSTDIGSPASPGASADNGQGTYTVQGAGTGFYYSSDSLTYAYQAITSSNITYTARIASQTNTNSYAQAGVMFRSGTGAGAQMAFMGLIPGFGPISVYRATANANANYNFTSSTIKAPYYVRLVRNGTTFTGSDSADGVTWTQTFSTTIAMGTTIDVGLADSDYQDGVYNTATFDHVLLNTPPTVATAASANPNPDGGLTTNLSVLGGDIAGESGLTYTWAATTIPSGAMAPTFSSNGTNAAKNDVATFHKAGTYVFTVTIADGAGYSVTSTVSVLVNQTLTSITASPSTVTLAQGATQQFAATAFDQFGQSLAIQPTFVYSVVAGGAGGTISSTGLYTTPTTTSGTDQVQVSSGSVTSTAVVTVTQVAATVSGTVGVSWGTAGTATLLTDADGLRLLPSGRNTDLPWLGINQLSITLSQAKTLSPSDVSVTGIAVANYGPVTISGSGTTYTITFATPMTAADRVTVTIANAGITSFTRRLDVLPGDVNDDGFVTSADVGLALADVGTSFIFADIDGLGTVTTNETKEIRKHNGTFLPPLG